MTTHAIPLGGDTAQFGGMMIPWEMQRPKQFKDLRESVLNTPKDRRMRLMEKQHFEMAFLERLTNLPRPDRFTIDQIMHAQREVGKHELHKQTRQEIFREQLNILDIIETQRTEKKANRLLVDGQELLNREISSKVELIRKITFQRETQNNYVMTSLLLGDLGPKTIASLADSYLVEFVSNAILEERIHEPTRTKVKNATSRREVDRLAQRIRKDEQIIINLQTRLLNARERFSILIDIWNSDGPEDIFHIKPWSAKKLRDVDCIGYKRDLNEHVQALEDHIHKRYGRSVVLQYFKPDEQHLNFARNLFNAFVEW